MLKSYPFQENILERFVENAIDQTIDACRKVDQDNHNIVSMFPCYPQPQLSHSPDAGK